MRITRCTKHAFYPVRLSATLSETYPYRWFAWHPVCVQIQYKSDAADPNARRICTRWVWLEYVMRTDSQHTTLSGTYHSSEYKEIV